MTWLLGLDVGTTAIKAVAYDPEVGRVACVATRPTPVIQPASGLSEHDPDALWEAAAGCLREIMAQRTGQMLSGLAIASLAEAGLPLDNGMHPLYPIIAWYDRRTEPQAAWWDSQVSADALHAITGQRVSPSFGVTKWLWIREHRPEVAARTARWLSVPDYVLWRLTGAEATDYSIASRTLLFSQRELTWSEELICLAGLRADQLPKPYPAGTVIGAVTRAASEATGLPAGLPCGLGGHDHLCASFSAGAYRPGVVADSSGTAQAVLAVLPAFHTSSAAAAGGFACYAHVVPGQYVLKAGMKLAGGAIEWLTRQLAGPSLSPDELPYEALAAEATKGIGLRAGPLWLPHLVGSGTPEGDRHSLAALVGLCAEHDRGDLFRGLLESLALWLRHNLEEMGRLTGQPASEVVLLGGTVRLSLLSQLKADCLGLPVVVPQLPEAAATGAALLAGLGTGAFSSPEAAVASLRYSRITVEPEPARVQWYDRLYRQVYCRLYADLREVNHELSGFSR
jgi:xylulokinase